MLRLLLCALLASAPPAAAAASSCPPRCECSEAAHTVKCVSRELREVPSGIPGYTRNLFLGGNRLSRLGSESFRGLENVTTLSLSNNRIWALESRALAGLRRLRSLDLSGNQLALIHPEAFAVPSQSLRELNLSRALYNRSSLAELAAALRRSPLGSLRGLDLSGNGLVFLPPRLFSRLSGLRRLLLANNSLVALHNASLSGLERLEELDLRLNALKTLPEEGLRELDSAPGAALLLGGNPFACRCGIEPLALWLNRSRGRLGDAGGLVCAGPAGMRNASLLALGALPLGCQQGAGGARLALHTSYVFLGLVLGFLGLIFLFVLYLNRRGIKRRVCDLRDACREVWEGHRYRLEAEAGPRLAQVGRI